MRPVVFKGCRGWFHSGSGDSGVILCSSIGEEDLRLHYHLVALSNIISSSGISVIRFNYRGTGDSADLNEGASEVQAWIDSIVDAVDWMRSQAGVRTFVLVGFKLGANLAAAAIPSLEKILALVLIAPVASGVSYASDLRRRSRLSMALMRLTRSCSTEEARQVEDGVWAGTFIFSKQSVIEIEALQLLNLNLHLPRRILFVYDPVTGLNEKEKIITFFEDVGLEVHEHAFHEYRELMGSPGPSVYPTSTFSFISKWIRDNVPLTVCEPSCDAESAVLSLNNCVESPFFFGENNNRFGIICNPVSQTPKQPFVLFLSSWWTPHVGLGRMWVKLARLLSQAGIGSLRLDVGGVGDSYLTQSLTGADRWISIPESAKDVRRALDNLQRQGYSRFALVGLCWGATLAATVSLQDPRVETQFLVNLPYKSATMMDYKKRIVNMTLFRDPKGWWISNKSKFGIGFVFNKMRGLIPRSDFNGAVFSDRVDTMLIYSKSEVPGNINSIIYKHKRLRLEVTPEYSHTFSEDKAVLYLSEVIRRSLSINP